MPHVRPPQQPEPTRFFDVVLLRFRDQRVVVGLVVAALLSMAAFRIVDYARGRRVVEFDDLERHELKFQVDVNRADAAELAQLPVIGPTLAARIVEHRREHGPFRTLDDLNQVSGIGPKTLDAIRAHVVFSGE
jgi:competence protein ComEA